MCRSGAQRQKPAFVPFRSFFMATYIVTTSNWNDSAFWASINEAGRGHTLDFSALPSTFEVDFWPGGDRIVLSDGTNSFVVGDSDFGGSSNATMGGTTQLQFFTTVVGSDGSDMIDGEAGDDNLSAAAVTTPLQATGAMIFCATGQETTRLWVAQATTAFKGKKAMTPSTAVNPVATTMS
jgi:hypothetical protein